MAVGLTIFNEPILNKIRPGFAPFRSNDLIPVALERVRGQKLRGVVYFYVVDDDNRLVGVVSTRALICAALDQKVGDIMHGARALDSMMSTYDALDFFLTYRFKVLPVIDDDGRYLGVLDASEYVDEQSHLSIKGIDVEDRRAQLSADEELFQLLGVHLDSAQAPNALDAFYARFPWLIANLVGGLLCAVITAYFHIVLEKAIAITFFVPVLLTVAEAVSQQSISVGLHAFRHGRLVFGDVVEAAWQHAKTGLALGLSSALLVSVVAVAWQLNLAIGLCILLSMTLSILGASLTGMLLPLIVRTNTSDPHLAVGPIALACVDVLTLLVYFTAALLLV